MFNLYDSYAAHLDLFEGEQRAIVEMLLKATPYYFPEAPDYSNTFDMDPKQLNLPNDIVWVQAPLRLKDTVVDLVYYLEKHSRSVILFKAEGRNLSILGKGSFVNDGEGIWLELDASTDLRGAYSTVFNILLSHINVLSPGTIRKSLSRPVARRAERSLGYPLKATTEIIIKPRYKPKVMATQGCGGEKCLHTVKGHVRVYRRGKPDEFRVWIESHDRGNPALGLKRTKYKVETD